MSFSNLSDIVKYLSDGDLVADKYGNDVRISESGNARFKTIKLDGNIDMNGFSITNLGAIESSDSLNVTVSNPSQPNITALGPLTSIVMAGDIMMNNNDILNAGDITASTLTGTLQTTAQPNITSVGTLSGLIMGGNIAMGVNNITGTGSISATSILATNLTGTLQQLTKVI